LEKLRNFAEIYGKWAKKISGFEKVDWIRENGGCPYLYKKNKKKLQLPINAAVGTVKIRPFGTNPAQ